MLTKKLRQSTAPTLGVKGTNYQFTNRCMGKYTLPDMGKYTLPDMGKYTWKTLGA